MPGSHWADRTMRWRTESADERSLPLPVTARTLRGAMGIPSSVPGRRAPGRFRDRFREHVSIEITQWHSGRGDDHCRSRSDAEIAGGSGAQPECAQLRTGGNQLSSQVGHCSLSQAEVNMSVVPKFPDLSAILMSMLEARPAAHATPGAICGPMSSDGMPRFCTTAPDVSPPATINWRTPAPTTSAASSAKCFQVVEQDCG